MRTKFSLEFTLDQDKTAENIKHDFMLHVSLSVISVNIMTKHEETKDSTIRINGVLPTEGVPLPDFDDKVIESSVVIM